MKAILVVALGLVTSPALAQPEFTIDQGKVYVTTPATCEALEKHGADALSDANVSVLTFAGGIQALDYRCAFFDVKTLPTNRSFFVSAICEGLDEIYPDTFAITPYDDKTIQVVSSYDAMMQVSGTYGPTSPIGNPGAILYHRCDNLSEIPVD